MITKKNIVFIAKSLDGYIADKNGGLDWLQAVPNPDNIDMGYAALLNEIDAILMGRNTYEMVLSFGIDWPYPKPVFVASTTLTEIPSTLRGKVSLVKGSPEEILGKVHKKGHFRLYIDGGNVIQSFLKAGLIDELRLTTMPILLGGGSPLFGELPKPLNLKHIASSRFLNAITQDTYKVINQTE